MNIGPASLVLTIYFAMFTFLYLVQINPILWPQNADTASMPCFVLFFFLGRRKLNLVSQMCTFRSGDLPLKCGPFWNGLFPWLPLFVLPMLILKTNGLHQNVLMWSALGIQAEDLELGIYFLLFWWSQPNPRLYFAIAG